MILGEFFAKLECFFATYSFAKETLLIVLGAILGGIGTVIINNGAIRKQCRFDMQYSILSDEAEKVSELAKKVETLEILLSFGSGETDGHLNEIEEIHHLLLKLNERLRDKRKFVRKYLSAVIVEKSAQYVTDYMKLLYRQGDNGVFDFQVITVVNIDTINKLREFEKNILKLSNDISDAMEKVISPGMVAKLGRKIRKLAMLIEECNAIRAVHKKRGR